MRRRGFLQLVASALLAPALAGFQLPPLRPGLVRFRDPYLALVESKRRAAMIELGSRMEDAMWAAPPGGTWP